MDEHRIKIDKHSRHSPAMTFFDSLGAVLGTTFGIILVVGVAIVFLAICCIVVLVLSAPQ